jgi:hypothetical protein
MPYFFQNVAPKEHRSVTIQAPLDLGCFGRQELPVTSWFARTGCCAHTAASHAAATPRDEIVPL